MPLQPTGYIDTSNFDSEIELVWSEDVTYNTTTNSLVVHTNRLWKSKVDDNLGNEPPTLAHITENDFWIEQSKATVTAPAPEYVPGTWFAQTAVWIQRNNIIYELNVDEEDLPFQSTDFVTELADGKWQQIISPDANAAGYNWEEVIFPFASNNIYCIAYGNSRFVAIGDALASLVSFDGKNFKAFTIGFTGTYSSICFGNGVFVAADSVSTDKIIVSPDGENWVEVTPPDINIQSICFGNGRFVAVGYGGVIISTDGLTWTSQTEAANLDWESVTYGNWLFVAVASSGTGNRVMTSENGLDWTSRTSAANNRWESVTYGLGLFVAVASSGTGNRVMTSENGLDWTIGSTPADTNWLGITMGKGLFVAIGDSANASERIMTSPDGFSWTLRDTNTDDLAGIAYGNGLFVICTASITGYQKFSISGKQEERLVPEKPTNTAKGSSFWDGTNRKWSTDKIAEDLYTTGGVFNKIVGLTDDTLTTIVSMLSGGSTFLFTAEITVHILQAKVDGASPSASVHKFFVNFTGQNNSITDADLTTLHNGAVTAANPTFNTHTFVSAALANSGYQRDLQIRIDVAGSQAFQAIAHVEVNWFGYSQIGKQNLSVF